jgi:hypothetical protein
MESQPLAEHGNRHAEGIGSFLPLPVTTDELVDAVNRMQADIDKDEG